MRCAWIALVLMLWLGGLTPCTNAQQEANTPPQPTQDAPDPEPHPDLKALLERTRSLFNSGKAEEALKQAEELLQKAIEKGDKVGIAWAHRLKALSLESLNRAQEACVHWEKALALWREVDEAAFTVEALLEQAECLMASDSERARQNVEQAVQRAKAETRHPNKTVQILLDFCRRAFFTAPDLAQRTAEAALALLERHSPESGEVAQALLALGFVFQLREDLERAQRCYERALKISEAINPNSTETAVALQALGIVFYLREDLAQAQRYYERALRIYEALNPTSIGTAFILISLGSVCQNRGDLAQAQRYYERALRIYETLNPTSMGTALTLSSLGLVYLEQGDLAQAQRYYERALRIYETLNPNSAETAGALSNLGLVFYLHGDLAQAQRYYERALKVYETLNPTPIGTALTLSRLGFAYQSYGDLAQAQRYYERALRIYETLNPNSVEAAGALSGLGWAFWSQGDLEQAQRCYEQALKRIELHRRLILNPEDRTLFTEKYFTVYAYLADIHLQQKRPAQAAEALERARARELTDALHKRQLQLPSAPPELQKLLQQQQALEAERYALHNQLRKTNPNDAEAIRALNNRLFELTNQQDKIDTRIRNEFPQYAQLLAPTPPSIKTIQQSLDNGVVMLYYALLPEELLIVAVSRQGVQGYRVPVKQEQLENAVQEFRRIISRPPLMRTASERRTLVRLGRQLYDWLVKPAAASLRGAKRVALCPEGVLNLLPWGALIVSTDKNGKPTYWVEQMTLHLTPSAGVYRQARGVKPASGGVMVAAVSEYGGFQQASAREVEALLRRSGTTLSNLPNVKAEVGRIQQVFRKGVRVAQEQAATPERVRVLAQGARVVHFSCHARADNADPYGSALLLAPAGRDEGLLEAAEVLGSWRLAADIVMLSACETGVGVLRRYEGMYGLARAFLFAGSRSVGASLWAVSDASTAALMGAFYGQYVKGVPKDEALRLAQLGLLRSKQYSDPYYWSAFVLIGDYR